MLNRPISVVSMIVLSFGAISSNALADEKTEGRRTLANLRSVAELPKDVSACVISKERTEVDLEVRLLVLDVSTAGSFLADNKGAALSALRFKQTSAERISEYLRRNHVAALISRPCLHSKTNETTVLNLNADAAIIGGALSGGAVWPPYREKVAITPKLCRDGSLMLDVNAKLWSVDRTTYEKKGVNPKYNQAAKASLTTASMPGDTLIIGGLTQKRVMNEWHPAPVINWIGGAWGLEKSHGRWRERNYEVELLVVITPSVRHTP